MVFTGSHLSELLVCVQSALHFRRWWRSRDCVCATMLAACTITAIAILIWSSRPGRVSKPDIHVRDVPSSNSGIVFPLYHYYRQFQNGSGRLGWRENRVGNGRRGILGEQVHSSVLMNVLGGHRLNIDDMYLNLSFQCALRLCISNYDH